MYVTTSNSLAFWNLIKAAARGIYMEDSSNVGILFYGWHSAMSSEPAEDD